ncbi:MFS transporter [Dendrosporobacter sp. 1207_IL3150]|uniref:MFS transporter n=1 Tax=Dendrosporobacter sp. 1207_IL3150 TaxID=3084054 RepID=UPI002FDAE3C8
MITTLISKFKNTNRDYLLFLLASVFIGISQSVDGSTLTNYLKEHLNMLILQRSALEVPRELPGLLVFLVIGSLYALGDVRIAVVANILAAIGMFLLGFIPPDYFMVVIVIFIYSMGQHMYMPLANSIGMSFAKDGEVGKKLGQMSALNTAALVVSSAVLWALFKFYNISYTTSFTIGAVSFLIAALLLFYITPAAKSNNKTRFIFRKEYRLYYWLCVLFGARKQIFITFGPWVLVDIFKEPVTTMTMLFFIISITGIFVKPLIGYLIDNVGEKFVLTSEAIAFFFVCLGYAFTADIFSSSFALFIINACYVLDQTLSSVSMARATYLRKIALKPEDVSPTLSLGTSIDHIVTMFLPLVGGMVWYNNGPNGYKYVFIGGALIALLNLGSAMFIKIPTKQSTQSY